MTNWIKTAHDVDIIPPGAETNEQYHASGAWGSTSINVFRKSPALAYLYRSGKITRDNAAALTFGSAFHAFFDDTFNDDFELGPDADRRTKKWKDAEAGSKRILIHPRDYDTMTNMAANLMANDVARRLLSNCQHEIGYRTTIQNVLVQCRCDVKGDGYIADIKTTQDVDEFRSSIVKYGYALQAGLYRQIVAKAEAGCTPEFYFIVVEKNQPYRCRVFFMTPAYADFGWKQASEALDGIAECEASGVWQDHRPLETLELPKWAEKEAV